MNVQTDIDRQLFLYKIDDSQTGHVDSPFDPDEAYPEYRFSGLSQNNYIYRAVREILRLSGLDHERANTPDWNPLGTFVQPGHTVLLKPNLVLHTSYNPVEDYYSVVTHPAIIRCVVDYVHTALKGAGKIIIGDAPLNDCKFEELCKNMGLYDIQELYADKGFPIELLDFRLYVMEKDTDGVIRILQDSDDFSNHRVVDFGHASFHSEYSDQFKKFRVTEYDGKAMPLNHNMTLHAYCVHKSVLEADLVISLPKIKTHHKAGITCAMKNLIGINGSKDWLPHHRKHSAEEGGDEYLHRSFRKRLISDLWDLRWKTKNVLLQKVYLRLERLIGATKVFVPFKDNYFEGSWWGNTTISRTINDLNRAIIYADKNGTLQGEPQRKVLYLVDGIICGEGEGPMAATSKRCNMILLGYNAFAVDMLVTKLMGFDYKKIDTLNIANTIQKYKIFSDNIENIEVDSNIDNKKHLLGNIRELIAYNFVPAGGWKGHIELGE